MPFQVSPGINITEIDLTTVIPAVSTTEGAIAGAFTWGPMDQRVLIDSEDELVGQFWKPNGTNANEWFTAANFLAYRKQALDCSCRFIICQHSNERNRCKL